MLIVLGAIMATAFLLPGLYLFIRISLPDPWGALCAFAAVALASWGLIELLQFTMS